MTAPRTSPSKSPQLRNEYLKTGFDCQHTTNSAGFGVLHDGSVDSLERFVSEPVFNLRSDQDVADLVAFILSFSGSDFPAPVPATALEPPGPPSQDTHAAVGVQTTLADAANPDAGQLTLIASMISLANTNKVGLVVKGRQNGVQRGYAYTGSSTFQSDHAGQTITAAALQSSAAPGSELTYTIVVKGTETRIGIDRDLNGILDFDEPPLPPVCGGQRRLQQRWRTSAPTRTSKPFFACLGGNCCSTPAASADFNNDGDVGTDSDIESFLQSSWRRQLLIGSQESRMMRPKHFANPTQLLAAATAVALFTSMATAQWAVVSLNPTGMAEAAA